MCEKVQKCVKMCKNVHESFYPIQVYKIVLIVNAPGTHQMLRALDQSSKGHRFESNSRECFFSVNERYIGLCLYVQILR